MGSVKFDAVISRLPATDGGVDELLSHIPDLLDGHRSRSRRSRRDGDVACAESLSARQRRFRGAARVVELGEDSRPAGVYGIDKDFQPRDVDIR